MQSDSSAADTAVQPAEPAPAMSADAAREADAASASDPAAPVASADRPDAAAADGSAEPSQSRPSASTGVADASDPEEAATATPASVAPTDASAAPATAMVSAPGPAASASEPENDSTREVVGETEQDTAADEAAEAAAGQPATPQVDAQAQARAYAVEQERLRALEEQRMQEIAEAEEAWLVAEAEEAAAAAADAAAAAAIAARKARGQKKRQPKAAAAVGASRATPAAQSVHAWVAPSATAAAAASKSAGAAPSPAASASASVSAAATPAYFTRIRPGVLSPLMGSPSTAQNNRRAQRLVQAQRIDVVLMHRATEEKQQQQQQRGRARETRQTQPALQQHRSLNASASHPVLSRSQPLVAGSGLGGGGSPILRRSLSPSASASVSPGRRAGGAGGGGDSSSPSPSRTRSRPAFDATSPFTGSLRPGLLLQPLPAPPSFGQPAHVDTLARAEHGGRTGPAMTSNVAMARSYMPQRLAALAPSNALALISASAAAAAAAPPTGANAGAKAPGGKGGGKNSTPPRPDAAASAASASASASAMALLMEGALSHAVFESRELLARNMTPAERMAHRAALLRAREEAKENPPEGAGVAAALGPFGIPALGLGTAGVSVSVWEEIPTDRDQHKRMARQASERALATNTGTGSGAAASSGAAGGVSATTPMSHLSSTHAASIGVIVAAAREANKAHQVAILAKQEARAARRVQLRGGRVKSHSRSRSKGHSRSRSREGIGLSGAGGAASPVASGPGSASHSVPTSPGQAAIGAGTGARRMVGRTASSSSSTSTPSRVRSSSGTAGAGAGGAPGSPSMLRFALGTGGSPREDDNNGEDTFVPTHAQFPAIQVHAAASSDGSASAAPLPSAVPAAIPTVAAMVAAASNADAQGRDGSENGADTLGGSAPAGDEVAETGQLRSRSRRNSLDPPPSGALGPEGAAHDNSGTDPPQSELVVTTSTGSSTRERRPSFRIGGAIALHVLPPDASAAGASAAAGADPAAATAAQGQSAQQQQPEADLFHLDTPRGGVRVAAVSPSTALRMLQRTGGGAQTEAASAAATAAAAKESGWESGEGRWRGPRALGGVPEGSGQGQTAAATRGARAARNKPADTSNGGGGGSNRGTDASRGTAFPDPFDPRNKFSRTRPRVPPPATVATVALPISEPEKGPTLAEYMSSLALVSAPRRPTQAMARTVVPLPREFEHIPGGGLVTRGMAAVYTPAAGTVAGGPEGLTPVLLAARRRKEQVRAEVARRAREAHQARAEAEASRRAMWAAQEAAEGSKEAARRHADDAARARSIVSEKQMRSRTRASERSVLRHKLRPGMSLAAVLLSPACGLGAVGLDRSFRDRVRVQREHTEWFGLLWPWAEHTLRLVQDDCVEFLSLLSRAAAAAAAGGDADGVDAGGTDSALPSPLPSVLAPFVSRFRSRVLDAPPQPHAVLQARWEGVHGTALLGVPPPEEDESVAAAELLSPHAVAAVEGRPLGQEERERLRAFLDHIPKHALTLLDADEDAASGAADVDDHSDVAAAPVADGKGKGGSAPVPGARVPPESNAAADAAAARSAQRHARAEEKARLKADQIAATRAARAAADLKQPSAASAAVTPARTSSPARKQTKELSNPPLAAAAVTAKGNESLESKAERRRQAALERDARRAEKDAVRTKELEAKRQARAEAGMSPAAAKTAPATAVAPEQKQQSKRPAASKTAVSAAGVGSKASQTKPAPTPSATATATAPDSASVADADSPTSSVDATDATGATSPSPTPPPLPSEDAPPSSSAPSLTPQSQSAPSEQQQEPAAAAPEPLSRPYAPAARR